jgi:hypothetical protein
MRRILIRFSWVVGLFALALSALYISHLVSPSAGINIVYTGATAAIAFEVENGRCGKFGASTDENGFATGMTSCGAKPGNHKVKVVCPHATEPPAFVERYFDPNADSNFVAFYGACDMTSQEINGENERARRPHEVWGDPKKWSKSP